MPGPLQGVKVVEFSHTVAMPSACAILGDWGADVIKIEHPIEGDPIRGANALQWLPPCPLNSHWELLNRNKRGIAVDLSKEQGRQIAYRLVEKADVFASNLQEPSLNRLAMDYDTLSRLNPRLIYTHLTGYGSRGPNREKPGYDFAAFWASSGLMFSMGERDGPPATQRGSMGDQVTSLAIAGGIAAALLSRTRTGAGQRVDISLLGAGIWMGGVQTQAVLLSGQEIERKSRKDMINPMWNYYQMRDGHWVYFTMQYDRFWPPFCRALGIPHLEHDPRFETMEKREEHRKELIAILDETFATKTLSEWVPIFDEHGLIWGPVNTVKEVIEDPQTEANGFVVEMDHPEIGKIRTVASPCRFSETPAGPRTPAPQLGQHTEEVLLDYGFTWEDLEKLKDDGVIL
ncbi:MAG: CoA transferase [Chloroflexota bacterium]|nr:CoA transferase [Chloroflexota bacterium]